MPRWRFITHVHQQSVVPNMTLSEPSSRCMSPIFLLPLSPMTADVRTLRKNQDPSLARPPRQRRALHVDEARIFRTPARRRMARRLPIRSRDLRFAQRLNQHCGRFAQIFSNTADEDPFAGHATALR